MATDESMWMEKVIAVGSEWIWNMDGCGLICFPSDRKDMDFGWLSVDGEF